MCRSQQRNWIVAIALTAMSACSGRGDGTSGNTGNPRGDGTSGNTGNPVSSNEKHFIYVDGAGACNGQTPCYTNLLDATIDSFRTQFDAQVRPIRPDAPPDRIVVMPGVYTAEIPGDWILILGFAAELNRTSGTWKMEIFSEKGPDQTIISGQNTGPCVGLMDQIDLHIKGFTFTGCADVEQFIINDDYSIFIQSFSRANVKIENNVFRDNTSPEGVIGISPYFVNVFELNVKIIGNRFFNNSFGRAIIADRFPSVVQPTYSATVLIANNLIYDNDRGIGIFSFGEPSQNIRFDIVGNTISGNFRYGLAFGDGKPNVQNNIVFGNSTDMWGPSRPTVNHNLVGEAGLLSPLGDNSIANPLFVNQAAKDFALMPNSPAIDSAVSLPIPELAFDLTGETRPFDGNGDTVAVPDIGAIEFR